MSESSEQGIYLGTLDDPGHIRRLLPDLSSAVYAAPGFVMFARGDRLMAAAFDLEAGQRAGTPFDVGEAVSRDLAYYHAGLSAAADGTVAVRPPPLRTRAPASVRSRGAPGR